MEKEVSEVDSTPLEVRGLALKPCLLWNGFPAIHGNHGDHGDICLTLSGSNLAHIIPLSPGNDDKG